MKTHITKKHDKIVGNCNICNITFKKTYDFEVHMCNHRTEQANSRSHFPQDFQEVYFLPLEIQIAPIPLLVPEVHCGIENLQEKTHDKHSHLLLVPSFCSFFYHNVTTIKLNNKANLL